MPPERHKADTNRKKTTPTKAGVAFFCDQVDQTDVSSSAAGGQINVAPIPSGHYSKEM